MKQVGAVKVFGIACVRSGRTEPRRQDSPRNCHESCARLKTGLTPLHDLSTRNVQPIMREVAALLCLMLLLCFPPGNCFSQVIAASPEPQQTEPAKGKILFEKHADASPRGRRAAAAGSSRQLDARHYRHRAGCAYFHRVRTGCASQPRHRAPGDARTRHRPQRRRHGAARDCAANLILTYLGKRDDGQWGRPDQARAGTTSARHRCGPHGQSV